MSSPAGLIGFWYGGYEAYRPRRPWQGARKIAESTAGASLKRNRRPRRGRRGRAAGAPSTARLGAGGTTYRRSGGQKRSVMAASKASSVCREKHRRIRVVAVRMTVDCCSPAAHADVGEWDGAEPSSCTSVTPRASPVRRIVSMSIVPSGCRNERLPRRYRRRAAAARQRIFAPVMNRGEPNCYAGCPANRQRECRGVSGPRVLRWHNHCFVGRRVGG